MHVHICTHYVHGLAMGRASGEVIGMTKICLSLQFLYRWLQYCLITLFTPETLYPHKTNTNWCGLFTALVRRHHLTGNMLDAQF